MSEKRFKLKENLEDVLIEDTITQSQYSIYGIVDLLNELSDENKRLSHKANFWENCIFRKEGVDE